jgi:hypothetical protein
MITITLPSSDVIQAMLEAKKDCTFVQGFFHKYHVKIKKLSIEIEAKDGYVFDPTDTFHLAWYTKEYV